MNSVLAVEKGLPPGLWLPTADESTEQYRADNFDHKNHPYEDVLDYGSFVVALAFIGSEETGRVSFMPSERDIQELYNAGYGLERRRLLAYGGIRKLQRGLGFYPREYEPTKEELMDRVKWVTDYAHPLDVGSEVSANSTFDEILEWGSARRVLPGRSRVYKVFDGDTSALRVNAGREKHDYRRRHTFHDLYRFGAKVIRENGGPITNKELNDKYSDEFITTPRERIVRLFGGLSNFWLEFGYALHMELDRETMLNLGTRWAIQHDGEIPSSDRIDKLSKEGLYPSRRPVVRLFGYISSYKQAVEAGYEEYKDLEKELDVLGVDPEVTRLAGRLYESGPDFAAWLKTNVDTLILLSGDGASSAYIRKLMKDGLDLESELVYEMQLEDLLQAMKRLGIKKGTRRFVLDIMPRLDPDEALGK